MHNGFVGSSVKHVTHRDNFTTVSHGNSIEAALVDGASAGVLLGDKSGGITTCCRRKGITAGR
ncbi:Uncharacterised protein [BD1-7 clade bacterium]|nr:Uncharacterised protein [BD1-7 clade bacterium]